MYENPTQMFPQETQSCFVPISFEINSCAFFLCFQKIPFMDVEYKREVRNAVKFLRETGRKVLEQREIDGKKGLPLPTDVISFVIAARSKYDYFHNSIKYFLDLAYLVGVGRGWAQGAWP